MGKKVDNLVLDGMLDVIATCTEMYVVTAEPANRAAAISTSLATANLSGGDFSIGDGDVDGRKITIAQQADCDIRTSGTATHVAICTSATLMLVTTCSTQSLASGGTVTVPAFDDEVADPT